MDLDTADQLQSMQIQINGLVDGYGRYMQSTFETLNNLRNELEQAKSMVARHERCIETLLRTNYDARTAGPYSSYPIGVEPSRDTRGPEDSTGKGGGELGPRSEGQGD